jgi:hypothetical protein
MRDRLTRLGISASTTGTDLTSEEVKGFARLDIDPES